MKREIEFQELNDEQLDQVVGGHGWHSGRSYTHQSNSSFIFYMPINVNVLGNQTNNQNITVNQSNWKV